ncbi:MAG: hypothetical protein D8M58_12430 [Calditrichaeota bacterium]|nr:MAG: hypothetical protein DWQ03_13215 [Calditrichota bacterium]MBL1206203.1 hypothetical protein [Calditrichota bacterium]NOG46028.1 hypothetical protein [Calditrichota bacterium]
MRRYIVYIFLILFLLSLIPLSAQHEIKLPPEPFTSVQKKLHPDAPPETKLLSQLFGEWDAYQVKRNKDGSWSSDTTHSAWRWYSILDGHAIQDDWITISPGWTPERKIVGTNIRIYNAKEKQWHMAWIDKTNRRTATFTAKNENDTVIMSGKNAMGRDVKITFYNFTKETFDWKQEWTFDGGQSWVEVTKMHCKRKL